MADEPARIILGDTVISTTEGKGLFRRRQKHPQRALTNCENCGAPLTGHYCAQCGQPAIDYRRSFRHVFRDIIESFFDWDLKFFATIWLLITRPWALTLEYLSGKRIRHMNPFRLYLLASIGFFFLVHYWTKDVQFHPGRMSPEERAKVAEQIKKGRDEIETELDKENLSGDTRRKVEQTLNALASPSPVATPSPETATSPGEQQNVSPTATPKSDEGDYGPFLQVDGHEPRTAFGKWLAAKLKDKIGEHGSKLALFFATLLQSFPYMILCCIPLFALILKLLYVRRRVFYIDHLIYALHIHSFVFFGITLLVFIAKGLHKFAPGMMGWIALLWLVLIAQILFSIRRVYKQGWFFSIFKFFLGGIVYIIVLLVGLVATLFINIAT